MIQRLHFPPWKPNGGYTSICNHSGGTCSSQQLMAIAICCPVAGSPLYGLEHTERTTSRLFIMLVQTVGRLNTGTMVCELKIGWRWHLPLTHGPCKNIINSFTMAQDIQTHSHRWSSRSHERGYTFRGLFPYFDLIKISWSSKSTKGARKACCESLVRIIYKVVDHGLALHDLPIDIGLFVKSDASSLKVWNTFVIVVRQNKQLCHGLFRAQTTMMIMTTNGYSSIFSIWLV